MSATVVIALSVPLGSPLLVAGIIALLVLGAAAVVIFALPSGDGTKSLNAQLTDYSATATGAGAGGLVETGVVQSAVDITAKIGERYGLLEKIERKLEQADLPLRAAEALFFYASALVVVFVISTILTGNFIAGLIVCVFIGLVPPAILNRRWSKRLKAFEQMLPDTLGLLAGTLRAGFSFVQGLETVANESAEPMRRELQRAFAEAKLGVPIEEALNDVADRMESEDLRWAVLAIAIQREVGGNLAELLDTVAQTMTQRERLRSEIKALTAEGRISAIVLGALPFGLGGMLYVINPDFISTLWASTTGLVLLFGSLGLSAFGIVWLKKTVNIEV
ncbi:MAG: type II secretion system F family protein [Acidimicrobiia bacterium]